VRDYLPDEHFRRLLALLDGHPLALQVILSRLRDHTPTQLWAELQQGEFSQLDNQSGDRTQSILACIEYAYHDIDPDDQKLLMCLAPFNGVIGVNPPEFNSLIDNYIKHLKQQPTLAQLPFERLPTLLKTTQQRGLMTPHKEVKGYLTLQPIFPYFLRNRIQATDLTGLHEAINTAFRQHYNDLGNGLRGLLMSKNPQEKQQGFILTQVEYENMSHALGLALTAQVSVLNLIHAILLYLDTTQDQTRGLKLGQLVLSCLEQYPAATKQGRLGSEFVGVLDDIASRYLKLKKYAEAEQMYQRALELHNNLTIFNDDTEKKKLGSGIYNNLGMVAEGQRQWIQAEGYYRQALQFKIESNNHYGQAITYNNLGMVAQEQRQWTEAEGYYQQALQIYVEFNDRYSQAMIYECLGVVAQKQRQWTKAEGYHQQALQLKIKCNDHYSQASTYHNLGILAQEQQKWMKAEEYYQQALQLFIEFNDRYNQANSYHELGMMAEGQHQWAQAEGYYQQALRIKQEFNDRYSQVSTYHQLGMVAQRQQQWGQAEGYYQQALQVCMGLNDRYEQAKSYGQLGLLAETQNQWAQAVDYLLEAMVIFAEYQDEHKSSIAMDSLWRVVMAANDEGLWDKVAAALGVSVGVLKEKWIIGATANEELGGNG